MAYIYSTQFLSWAAEETPAPYEVPTGYIAVVRDIDLVSGGGAVINFEAGIATGAKIWAGQFTVESLAQSAQWRGRQVVLAGQSFFVAADGSIDGSVSGYLLADVFP